MVCRCVGRHVQALIENCICLITQKQYRLYLQRHDKQTHKKKPAKSNKMEYYEKGYYLLR